MSFEDADRLASSFRPLRSEALSDVRIGHFWVRSTKYEPELVRGFSPEELESFTTDSFARVQKNTRWRFSRKREDVERKLAEWYAQAEKAERWKKQKEGKKATANLKARTAIAKKELALRSASGT